MAERAARSLAVALTRFVDVLRADAERVPGAGKLETSAASLLEALGESFALDGVDLPRKAALQNSKLKYQKRCRRDLEEVVNREGVADTGQHALELIWFVRSGLSSPLISAKTLVETYRDFSLKGENKISETTVYHTRNAWAELVTRDHQRGALPDLHANSFWNRGLILKGGDET